MARACRTRFWRAKPRLLRLIGTRDRIPLPISVQGRVPRAFTRNDLERFASGRISEVFGEAFRGQDGFARQVRMPEPPLLLVDRVVDLTGEPDSLGLWGRIVTKRRV